VIRDIIVKNKDVFKRYFDDESKKLFKNSSWVFIANTYGLGLAFLRSVLIARGLGAETLGIYTVIIAFVVTIQEIVKLNVPFGILKYGSHFISSSQPEKLVSLLKNGILASLFSAAISIIIISILSHFTYDLFFNIPGLEKFIILYAIINGLTFIDNIGRATLKIFYRFKINSLVQITMDTVEFIIIFTCIYLYKNNINYFFYAIIFSKLLNSTICNLSVYFELRKHIFITTSIKLKNHKLEFIEIRNYIVGNSFGNTLKTFMNQGDVLLLNIWGTPTSVGFYAIAKKLAYAILTVTDPLVTSIYPQLAHLISQNKFVELKKMLGKITRITLLPVTFFTIIVFIFKSHIITFIYGIQFEKAAPTFFIHFVGAVQGSLFFWCLPLIMGLGLTYIRIRSYLIAIIVNLIITCSLAPIYGANGVAIGLLIANIITTIYFVYYSYLKINENIKITIPK